MHKAKPDVEIIKRHLERLLRRTVSSVQPVAGGYTSTHRLRVQFVDGLSVFAKIGVCSTTSEWLRQEYKVYAVLFGDFMARVITWDDVDTWTYDGQDYEGHPVLVLEDLSRANWKVTWTKNNVELVRQVLSRVHAQRVPKGLPTLESLRHELASWHLVAKEPARFLQLGLVSKKWLQTNIDKLIAAEDAAELEGSELLHFDIRSDNLCILDHRVILVDWNWACIGNGKADLAAWLPSLRAEGGPDPESLLPQQGELAAIMAGFWAYRAGQPPLGNDNGVRELQLKQLKVALPWCARALKLEPPDGQQL
jgi:hypothetical protein